MLLPHLRVETLFSVLAKFRGQPSGQAYASLIADVGRENPEVVRLLEVWAEGACHAGERMMCVFGGLMVYAALKSQAEADDLAKELKGRL